MTPTNLTVLLRKQDNHQSALAKALDKIRSAKLEDITALGAMEKEAMLYELPVLESRFLVDLANGTVEVPDGNGCRKAPRLEWQILALHYLAANPLPSHPHSWACFSDIPDARGYDPVYRRRVLGRLCDTVGRERQRFVDACLRLGGKPSGCGDEGFQFRVFPCVEIMIAWFCGGDEFRPGASFLYSGDIGELLSVEDVVVLSERIVGRLEKTGW